MKNKKFLRNAVIVIGVLGLLGIGILILISYFRPAGQLDADESVQETQKPEAEILGAEALEDLDTFEVSTQRIRVWVNDIDGYIRFPAVEVIHSVDELRVYYERNKEKWRFHLPDSNTVPSFVEACEKYDEAYFDNQILVLVILAEPRGSGIGHNVVQAGFAGENQDRIVLDIITTINGGTLDSPKWFLLIEPEPGVTVEDKDDVTVFLDGENATDLPILAELEIDDVSIGLEIPKNWSYEIVRISNYSNEFYIAFWPEDKYEGKIKVGHYKKYKITLEPEDVHLGDSESGRFVVQKENTDIWWSEYGEEAMQILSTVRLGGVEE